MVAVLLQARGWVLALLCAPAVAFGQAAAPATSSPAPLTFGVTLTDAQRADETKTYAFVADEGRNYLIEVDQQQSLDLVVTLERPDGGTEAFDLPTRRVGTELVLLERAEPGMYRVILRSEEYTGAVGR